MLSITVPIENFAFQYVSSQFVKNQQIFLKHCYFILTLQSFLKYSKPLSSFSTVEMGLYYYHENQYIGVAYELITDYRLSGGFNKTGKLQKSLLTM